MEDCAVGELVKLEDYYAREWDLWTPLLVVGKREARAGVDAQHVGDDSGLVVVLERGQIVQYFPWRLRKVV